MPVLSDVGNEPLDDFGRIAEPAQAKQGSGKG
jgi:hypothetical protein